MSRVVNGPDTENENGPDDPLSSNFVPTTWRLPASSALLRSSSTVSAEPASLPCCVDTNVPTADVSAGSAGLIVVDPAVRVAPQPAAVIAAASAAIARDLLMCSSLG